MFGAQCFPFEPVVDARVVERILAVEPFAKVPDAKIVLGENLIRDFVLFRALK